MIMARKGINKVIVLGNLGQDPETRYMPNGNAVTNIDVATSESWKDKNTGQDQERTEWHRIVFFNKLAEIAGEYLRKGSKVYIEGQLRTKKWQDQSGADRYTTEIIASEMQMLSEKQHTQQEPQQQAGGRGGPNTGGPRTGQYDQNQQPSQQYKPTQQPAGTAQGGNDFDDGIPF